MTQTKQDWQVPEWMESYRGLITGIEDYRIEEMVNDDGTNSNTFNNPIRALMCVDTKAQVSLLERLHEFGLLPTSIFDERQCSRCGKAVGKKFYVGTGMIDGRMRGAYLCPWCRREVTRDGNT